MVLDVFIAKLASRLLLVKLLPVSKHDSLSVLELRSAPVIAVIEARYFLSSSVIARQWLSLFGLGLAQHHMLLELTEGICRELIIDILEVGETN